MRPHITVLIDAVPCGRHAFIEMLKKTARFIRGVVWPRPQYAISPYRGHFAVTRSMVEGFQKIGCTVSYNPLRRADVGSIVVVPAGYSALRQAIRWKRAGAISTLIAGPNLV